MTAQPSQVSQQCKENVSRSFEVVNVNLLGLYSFYDTKADKFMPPFFALNEQEAIRQAQAIVNFSNSLICKFPEDYDLFYIGCFSEDTGHIEPVEVPKLVQHCKALKTEQSIRYDELLKEVEKVRVQATSVLNDYEKVHSDYENKVRILSTKIRILDNIESKNKSVELFPTEKKSILKRLFK